jgi:hypothetical protein
MEHRDAGPDTKDRPVAALRELLNAWDPIGVVGGGGPQDEYDCLIAPMLDQLEGGAESPELAAFLRFELDDHFGLDPELHAAAIDAVSQGVVRLRARG